MVSRGIEWYGGSPNGTEGYQTVPRGTKWYRGVLNGTEGYPIVPRGTEWNQGVQNFTKRYRMVPRGIEWYSSAPARFKFFLLRIFSDSKFAETQKCLYLNVFFTEIIFELF